MHNPTDLWVRPWKNKLMRWEKQRAERVDAEREKKWEKREFKGPVRRKRTREREKKNKKSFTHWIVIVHICTVTVHLHNRVYILHNFTSTDVGIFLLKLCKICTFFYFRRLYLSWWDALSILSHHCQCIKVYFNKRGMGSNTLLLGFSSLAQSQDRIWEA